MKKRLSFFVLGAILFLISLPQSTVMILELFHNQLMNLQYEITAVNEGFPSTDSTYRFKDRLIEIKETIKETKSYQDPWDNKLVLADLSVELDGKELDVLKNYPIRVEEEGLNRYYGELAYLILKDEKVNKTQFIILLKKTRELYEETPNGDIVGGAPDEELNYKMYLLDEEGKLESESFSFTDRTALQTELLNAGVVAHYSSGYYTDAWNGYPTLFFPFIFPFLTFIIGLILIVFFFPIRKNHSVWK